MRTNWKRLLAAGLVGLAPCGSVWAEEGASTVSAPPAADQPAEEGVSGAGGGSSSEGGAAAGGTLSGAPSGFGGGGGQAAGSGGGFWAGGMGGRGGGGGQPAFGAAVNGEGGLTGSITVVGVGPGGAGAATMPNSLEEAIGLAMRANPEVQLARAKVDEARASYNQTRLRIVAELTQIYRQREALQQDNALEAEASASKAKAAKEAAQQNEKLRATGALPEGALQQAIDAARSAELDHQRVVLGHRQKLASFDTQLMLLMGLESPHASDASLRYFREGEGGGNSRGMMGSFFGGVGAPGMPGGMMGGGGGAAGGGGGTIGPGGGSSGGGHAASGGPAGGGGAPTGGGAGEGSAPAGAGSSTGGGPAGAGSGEGGAATGGGGAPQANTSAQQLYSAFVGMGGAPGGGMAVMSSSMGGNSAAANARPSIPESQKHLKDELEKVTQLDLSDSPLPDVVMLLKNQTGIEIQIGPGVLSDSDRLITMSASGIKFKDMLLLMTDLYPDLCFVVRDYGLLVSTREKGMELYGAAIPADLPLLTAPATPRAVVY